MGIMIEKRIEKFVKCRLIGENEDAISIYLNDIKETFHFENEIEAQDFLNKQVVERFGDYELKKDYFDYKDQEGLVHRYFISKVYKGEIVSYLEEVVEDVI